MLPNLSVGWNTRPLSEICDLIMGQAPAGDTYNDKGIGTPLIAGAADLGPVNPKPKKWTTSPTKVGKKGDIILCVRATIGDLNWADAQYCYGRGVAGVRFRSKIDPEFIWFWLTLCVNHLLSLGRGATFKQISKTDIARLPVPDLELAEQRSIVARIKNCMEKVEEIELNSQAVESELGALFPSMLNEKFKELQNVYPYKILEDIAEIKGGSSLPKGSSNDLGNASALLVKVGDMNEIGNERLMHKSREYFPLKNSANKVIAVGAVIFPKRGGAIATNKKRMLGRPALLDPNLMAVIAKPDQVLSEYLYYWTQTFDLADISNGGVIPQLNRKDLAPLKIPVPDLTNQVTIVNEFEEAEASCLKLLTLFKSADKERKALRESILRKAFVGEL